jgi:hypothetical protein
VAVLDLGPNQGVGTLVAEIVMRRVGGRAELSVLLRCRVTKSSIFPPDTGLRAPILCLLRGESKQPTSPAIEARDAARRSRVRPSFNIPRPPVGNAELLADVRLAFVLASTAACRRQGSC